MSDVQAENYALASTTNAFSAIWKLTRCLKAAGWTYLASADGSTKDSAGTTDKWGNTGTPLTETYPTGLDSVAAWWVGQGPSVLKLEMTSAPTGTFIRGEPVTQATSGATGEFLGYDFDSGSGHAVILPRTGTWDGSHTVTGGFSAATFTPTALKTFVCEVMFFKTTNTTSGIACYQRVDASAESSSRFSAIAGSAAGCTATVAPGAGGTGNSFPTAGSFAFKGDIATPTHALWFNISINMGKAQIVVANATPGSGASADGSWLCGIGNPTSSATAFEPLMMCRCDDGEPADLDPFVTIALTGTAANNANVRTNAAAFGSTWAATSLTGIANNGSAHIKGWRRRGFASNDAFVAFKAVGEQAYGDNVPMSGDAYATPQTIACSYKASPPRRLWKLSFESAVNTTKMAKGSPRWIRMVQGGATFDTLDSKTRMLITTGASGGQGSMVHGLFDGSTSPVQS